MAPIYPTEFSDLSNLPKKEIKIIESKFPFVPPDDIKFEPCGQIVSKMTLVQIQSFAQSVISQ